LGSKKYQPKCAPVHVGSFALGWPHMLSVGDKHAAEVKKALLTLNRVYEGCAFDSKYKMGDVQKALGESAKSFGSEYALVYGEISPFSLVSMFCKVCATPGQRFYDLGSGTGKAVVLAKLLGLTATGIEIFEDRWLVSCEAKERLLSELKDSDGIQFLHANVLDVDFTDADLVLCTDILWPAELRAGVANIARGMQRGSFVVTNEEICDDPGFDLLTEIELVTNWNSAQTYLIHIVTGNLQHDHGSAAKPEGSD